MQRVILARQTHITEEELRTIEQACNTFGVKLDRSPTRIHLGAALAALRVGVNQLPSPARVAAIRTVEQLVDATDGCGDFHMVALSDDNWGLPSAASFLALHKKGDQYKFIAAALVWGLRDRFIESSDGYTFESDRRNDDLLIFSPWERIKLDTAFAAQVEKHSVDVTVNNTVYRVVKVHHGVGRMGFINSGVLMLLNMSAAPVTDEKVLEPPTLDIFDLAADALGLEVMQITEAGGGFTFYVDGAPNVRVTILTKRELDEYNSRRASEDVIVDYSTRSGFVIIEHVSGTWTNGDITRAFLPMEKVDE